MILSDLDALASWNCDVCIIGSGPVGSSLAVDLSRRGLSVIVLESGLRRPDHKIQSLSDAEITYPQAHHRMELAVSRSLGGTSRLWGGRSAFLDEIDFERRDYVPNSGWPISFADLAPHQVRAAELIGCDDGPFKIRDSNEMSDADVDMTHFERWVNNNNGLHILAELGESRRIKVILNATVVGLQVAPGERAIRGVRVARAGRKVVFGGATFYVLALGGIETARFLLNVQAEHPRLFGGNKTTLGRYYMGHASGSIAGIRFFDPGLARYFAYLEGSRSFARRRLTLKNEAQRVYQVPNVSFWPENSSASDPDHASGILSAIALVVRLPVIGSQLVSEAIRQSHRDGPGNLWPHLKNLIQDAPGLVAGAAEMLRQRVRYGRRLPRMFITNPQGTYPLRFHSEQFPTTQNNIRLSSEQDWLGLRRAVIDFKFSVEQMERIVDAHRILDRALRRLRIGTLVYKNAEGRLDGAEQVHQLELDGLHQIGLTRMAAHASAGVVDPNCRIFEFQNLFVAGSSTFPTSGRAPPTLPAIALAVRLSEYIAKYQTNLRNPVSNIISHPW